MSISVQPLREEEVFYADKVDKERVDKTLDTLRKAYTELRTELVNVHGVSLAELQAPPPYRPRGPSLIISREVGFLNFLRELLTGANHVSTYAVTPKESVQRISNALAGRDTASVSFGAGLAASGPSAASQLDRSYETLVRRDAIERSPLVVGFSDDSSGRFGKEARFGWIFGPRYRLGQRATDTVTFRHTSTQQAVSVIVAAPSWWTEATLDVDVYWQADDGTCKRLGGEDRASCDPFSVPPRSATDAGAVAPAAAEQGTQRRFSIRLPGASEGMTGALLSIPKRPRIHKKQMETQFVVEGQPADVVIPGSYLWRGSKVMLGSQLATSIIVLPDMTGIIAHFNEIGGRKDAVETGPNPTSPARQSAPNVLPPPRQKNVLPDETEKQTLTIWTSDGKDSDTEKVLVVRKRAPGTKEVPEPAQPAR
jgi:hypothetical protein